MTILVDYLCGKPKADPRDRAMFTDLTEARDALLSQRTGLGEAVSLIVLLESPCELRVRRSDLPAENDRSILAGILEAADSRLILCHELGEGSGIDQQEWRYLPGRTTVVDEIVALAWPASHRTLALTRDELSDKARRMHDGLALPYRLIALLLSQAQREATGETAASVTMAQATALAQSASPLLTRELADRMRARKVIDESVLDLSGVTDVAWAELAPALLMVLSGRVTPENIIVDDDWSELTPIRWQILSRLTSETGGAFTTGYQGRLAPAEAQIVNAAIDFVRNVYVDRFGLMIDHPGRGLGLKLAIERFLRAQPTLTLERLAEKLNEAGYPARRSGQWVAANVREVMILAGISMPSR